MELKKVVMVLRWWEDIRREWEGSQRGWEDDWVGGRMLGGEVLEETRNLGLTQEPDKKIIRATRQWRYTQSLVLICQGSGGGEPFYTLGFTYVRCINNACDLVQPYISQISNNLQPKNLTLLRLYNLPMLDGRDKNSIGSSEIILTPLQSSNSWCFWQELHSLEGVHLSLLQS